MTLLCANCNEPLEEEYQPKDEVLFVVSTSWCDACILAEKVEKKLGSARRNAKPFTQAMEDMLTRRYDEPDDSDDEDE